MAMVAVAVEKPLPVDPNGGCDHVTATKRSACLLLLHHSGGGVDVCFGNESHHQSLSSSPSLPSHSDSELLFGMHY